MSRATGQLPKTRFISAPGPLLLMLGALCSVSQSALSTDHSQRLQYRQALDALAAEREQQWTDISTALSGYVLAPYLQFHHLRKNLDQTSPAVIRDFLNHHGEIAAAADLRRAWLRYLAKKERWDDYLADYTPQSDVSLRCAQLSAQLATNGRADLSPRQHDLWLSADSRPKACDPVFNHWRRSGQLTPDLIHRRAVVAARGRRASFARYLARTLPAPQQSEVERWIALSQDPVTTLEQAKAWPDQATSHEQIIAGLTRLTREDGSIARKLWQQLEPNFAWSDSQRRQMTRESTLFYAVDYPNDAFDTLMRLPDQWVDSQIRQWRIRVGLKEGLWSQMLPQLDALPTKQQADERWRYWRARSLEASGYQDQADALYHALAKEANYYGFLAAERTGQPPALCPQLRDPDLVELATIGKLPAMQRAIELFHVGDWHYARLEWRRAMRQIPPEQRRQAALLAHAEGWHDRAVLTLADSGHRMQYAVRFPLAWHSEVTQQAKQWRLDSSLIYGVMRSESALVIDAISGAGARGLMQLTPATGRQVALAKQLPMPSRSDLLKANTNIMLGAAYLDELFQRFEHPLEVLAAYNAGPEPVQKWRGMNLPREPDRWIETLPYFETRDYLPRVLAFAAIYDWRQSGRMQPLALRMPHLDRRPGKIKPAADKSISPVCASPDDSIALDQSEDAPPTPAEHDDAHSS